MEINIGLDALGPDTHQKMKGLTEFDTVVSGIKSLVKLKSELKLDNLKLILQFIVTQTNYDEALEFEKQWRNFFYSHNQVLHVIFQYPYLDDRSYIWFRQKDDVQNELHNKLRKELVGGKELPEEPPSPSFMSKYFGHLGFPLAEDNRYATNVCGMLWDAINIWSDGTVDPCCVDVYSNLKIGNINEKTLKEVFSDGPINRLKLAHINGNLGDYPHCVNCASPHKGNSLPRALVKNYLKAFYGENSPEVDVLLNKLDCS